MRQYLTIQTWRKKLLSDFKGKRSELERFSVMRREISLERAWKVAMV